MSQLTSPVEIYWISGSPFAWRVLLAAEVKGIPYEGKLFEASKGELKTPEFLAINPLGRVPAIRDGNFTLHGGQCALPRRRRDFSSQGDAIRRPQPLMECCPSQEDSSCLPQHL
jgi:hypothetical protein